MSRSVASARPAPDFSSKGDLTQGPVTNHLVRLTIPMIWGLFAIISFQLVDIYFISRLGTEALAAISFTFPVTYGVFCLTLGMGIATSSVVSRQIGSGHWLRARRLTSHALLLAFIMGLLFAVLGLLIMNPVFRLMGAPPEMMPLIRDYMVIWFAGNVFVNTPLVGNAAIRASGDALSPALIMTVAALINVILDPILIFGLFGFPRLEIQGAAIATVFGNGCSMMAGLYIIAYRKKMMISGRRHFHLLRDSAKRLFVIALPAGLTSALQPLTAAIITALIASYSTEAVAAFGIVTRVESFAFIIIMALASAMSPVIGQNWGGAHYDRVNQTLKKAFVFAVSWSLLVAGLFVIFAEPLATLFSNEDAVIQAAILYLWIVPITYALGNLVPGWASAFNAMGMPERSFIMIFVRLIVINIPLAFIGAHYFGVAGIFGAIAVTNMITGITFHLWNRRFCLRQGKGLD